MPKAWRSFARPRRTIGRLSNVARLRFSETLSNKRRELGLTIEQASSVLKLKESVLIAFEEGDFENMPKSGYAQGMLASYARYLGLSPREIVDMYSEELYEYIHGSSSHDLRRRTRDTRSGRIIEGYDVPNESESRPKAYVQLQSYLPTAGGPMGDYGAFATTSGVHARTTGAAVPMSTSMPGANSPYGSDYAASRADETVYGADRPRTAAGRRRDGDGQRRNGRALRRDDITTRSVLRDQYRDDRAFDSEAVPYEAASSQAGRRSAHTIASIERPNIDRTRMRPHDPYGRRDGQPSADGVVGSIVSWFSDARHALFTIVVALGLILTVIAIFSIKSCVSNTGTEVEAGRTVGVTPAQTDDGADAADGTAADAGDGASEQTPAAPVVADKPEEPTVVTARVTVADGQVSWLEITADGESVIADTVNGPWEQTFDVKNQLVVRAGDTSAVSVFVNGEQRQFEMKTSGVGTITVDGPPQPATVNDKKDDSASAETPSADEPASDEQPAAEPAESEEKPSTNTDGDEYQYTYNGYDIYIDHTNGNLYCIDPETGAKLNPADGTPYVG